MQAPGAEAPLGRWSLSGAFSVITGLRKHSLGVFAVGLGVLADVAGSAVLVWQFGAERRRPMGSGVLEARAADGQPLVVAAVAAVEAWRTMPRR